MTSSLAALRIVVASSIALGDDLVATRARLDLGVARDPRRLQLGFGEHCSCFGLGRVAVLGTDRGGGGRGIGAALLQDLCCLGACVGADRGGLLRSRDVRRFADLRGSRLGGHQLELRGQPRLAQGGRRHCAAAA